MPSWMTKLKRMALALAVLLLLSTFVFSMLRTAADRPGSSWVERAAADLLFPFQVVASWVVGGAQVVGQEVTQFFTLRDENRRLREEVAGLRLLKVENAELQAENRVLREQVGLVQRAPFDLLAAEVIARYPGTWFQTVVIARGSRDGVQRDMAVISPQGLVGRVQRVSAQTAVVQLLIEPMSAVGAMDLTTAEAGTLVGEEAGVLRLTFFNWDAPVNVGDPVITSGLGSTVPRGLFIGTVAEVGRHQDHLVPFAVVQPAVDFNHLDKLAVVLSAREPVPDDLAASGESGRGDAGPGLPAAPREGVAP